MTQTIRFENLQKIDASAIQAIINEADQSRFILAMKGASEPLRELVFSSLPEEAANALQKGMSDLGAVPLTDVEDAQKYVADVAQKALTN